MDLLSRPVDQASSPEEKIALFRSLFRVATTCTRGDSKAAKRAGLGHASTCCPGLRRSLRHPEIAPVFTFQCALEGLKEVIPAATPDDARPGRPIETDMRV
jgi:hypothetical protein